MLPENSESSLHDKCQKIIKSITELPFVDCGVPRALLTAIIESNKSSIKALSLRALATVCVTGDAVKQFEEVRLWNLVFPKNSLYSCLIYLFLLLFIQIQKIHTDSLKVFNSHSHASFYCK